MDMLRVFLLGRFHIQSGEQILTTLNTAKQLQELFSYLLLYQERPHFRETLANLLWDETATTQPQRCLRKTLWSLRDALDAQIDHLSEALFLIEPEWIQINPEANLWLDTAIFEQAFATVRDVPGAEITSQSAENLKNVVDLYHGDLLEGVYHDWAIYERERFQHMYLVMLSKLMDYCEAHQEYKAGIDYGTRILYYDRAHERTHRQLMRLYCLDDNRTEALRQYERFTEALDSELGVKPTQRTRALYQQIRQDQFNTPTASQDPDNAPANVAASVLPDMLNRLRQFQATLVEMQTQVYKDIQIVDCLLNGRC
ncbi:MAG: BTAD domain-containing putative transcriptional regulator [Anaerolineae bacterium]|jgi:DNA-binding SARP family transcriptional activator